MQIQKLQTSIYQCNIHEMYAALQILGFKLDPFSYRDRSQYVRLLSLYALERLGFSTMHPELFLSDELFLAPRIRLDTFLPIPYNLC